MSNGVEDLTVDISVSNDSLCHGHGIVDNPGWIEMLHLVFPIIADMERKELGSAATIDGAFGAILNARQENKSDNVVCNSHCVICAA